MTRRPSARAACALAVAAFAAGGCGNTSEDPSSTTAAARPAPRTQLTKAQFVRATAKLCARVDRDIGAFLPLGTDPATRRANRSGIITLLRRHHRAIRALGYPAGIRRADLDGFLRASDGALDRAAARNTVDIEQELLEAQAPYAKMFSEYMSGCEE